MNSIKIKISNILKIKKHQYFNSTIENYKEINKILQRKIKTTMLAAMMHNSSEVLMIIDNSTFNHRITTSNDMNNVTIPEYIVNIITDVSTDTTFTMIHNHPDNSGFSIMDLRTFINRDKIAYIFVCTNDCRIIAVLGKNNINQETKFKMLNTINKYMIINNYNEHSPAIELIEFFEQKGLLYAAYKNY
jgi:hypothetical protein